MRRRNGFAMSVLAPIAAWLLYDAVRVRSGWSSTSSDLREYCVRHPYRCGGAVLYLTAHIIGDLLLPAWLCRHDPLAFVARRLVPRTTMVVRGNAPEERLRRLLEADKAETVRQIRAIRSAA